MKVSEINIEIVEQYLQLEIDKENPAEALEMNMYIEASKSYLSEYTGLTLEEIDEYTHLVPPTLLLISDMYENKTLDGSKVENRTFRSLININKKVSL